MFEKFLQRLFRSLQRWKQIDVIAAHTIGTAEGNKEILDSLELINGKYFNAELYIDYKEWRERKIESKLQKMLFLKSLNMTKTY